VTEDMESTVAPMATNAPTTPVRLYSANLLFVITNSSPRSGRWSLPMS